MFQFIFRNRDLCVIKAIRADEQIFDRDALVALEVLIHDFAVGDEDSGFKLVLEFLERQIIAQDVFDIQAYLPVAQGRLKTSKVELALFIGKGGDGFEYFGWLFEDVVADFVVVRLDVAFFHFLADENVTDETVPDLVADIFQLGIGGRVARLLLVGIDLALVGLPECVHADLFPIDFADHFGVPFQAGYIHPPVKDDRADES